LDFTGTVASAAGKISQRVEPRIRYSDKKTKDKNDKRSRDFSPVKKIKSPERRYDNKRICVGGIIDSYRGIPQIIVRETSQIR